MFTLQQLLACLLTVLLSNSAKCPVVRTVSVLLRSGWSRKLFRNRLWLWKIVNFCTRWLVEFHDSSAQLALHQYQYLVYRYANNINFSSAKQTCDIWIASYTKWIIYYVFIDCLMRIRIHRSHPRKCFHSYVLKSHQMNATAAGLPNCLWILCSTWKILCTAHACL